MDVEKYLRRIGCTRPPAVDLQTLNDLHLLHLRAVPFENLDIHANREIVLREDSLFEKIVERRRGGICYELNCLFASLLRTLGFDVALLSANVYSADAGLSPDFDHMVLLVTIDERHYLADVGFGDSFATPIDLAHGGDVSGYQISRSDDFYILARATTVDEKPSLLPVFRFDLMPRSIEDFLQRCNFHQNSSASHFRRKVLCSRADRDGRITVSGRELIITRGGARAVTELLTPEDVEAALHDHFGVVR